MKNGCPILDEDLILKAVTKIGGEDAKKIVKFLLEKGKATEDEITKATEVKLNEIRKILFKLHGFNLAVSQSIQDKKTGWLIFYWRVQPEQHESVIRTQKRRILERLKTRSQYEQEHDFYYCFNETCRKLTFEEAMESIFKCPTCGKTLQHFDNAEVIERLSERVNALKNELDTE